MTKKVDDVLLLRQSEQTSGIPGKKFMTVAQYRHLVSLGICIYIAPYENRHEYETATTALQGLRTIGATGYS